MNIIRNEKGFMLILTLIVISVISIFFLTFIQMSATQNKQVERTSDIYEVTSVAEMGVEYYTAVLKEIIAESNDIAYGSIERLNKELIDEEGNFVPEKINSYDMDLEAIINTRNVNIESQFNNLINNKKNFEGNGLNGIYYQMSSGYMAKKDNELEVNFEVSGRISDEKEKVLKVSFKIPELSLEPSIIPGGGTGTGDGSSDTLPPKSIVIPPSPIVNKNENIANYFIGNDYKRENALDLTNDVKIHAEGNIHLSNLNNMNSLELFTNGNINITQPTNAQGLNLYANNVNLAGFNKIANSDLQINGNAKFNNIENVTNTKINILGNANVYNKIYMNDASSFINIEGTLTVEQSNSQLSMGTIVVNRLEYANSNGGFSVDGTGKLCVKDISSIGAFKDKKLKGTASAEIYFLDTSLSPKENKKIVHSDYPEYGIGNGDVTGNQTRVVGEEKFEELCGVMGSGNNDSGTSSGDSTPINIKKKKSDFDDNLIDYKVNY